MSYTQTLYQIVFGTYKREHTLDSSSTPDLYRFIWGLLKNMKCHLYRINGVEDHIHIVLSIHPTIAPANLIKDIKLGSTDYIKSNNLFPSFQGWARSYGLFTYAWQDKDRLIEYVKNQQEHHRKKSFKKEMIEILDEYGIDHDPKYID